MDLKLAYEKVSEAIRSIDFERVWPGFEPLKFALYDSENCFFDGRWVEKTDAFCANTSIEYEGEQIAIWYMDEETPTPVLASKMVHEMFHGFQTLRGWDCWPNESEALFRYEYDARNIAIKLRENELLSALLTGADDEKYRELLSLRRLRSGEFPYQFAYESKGEEIEGTANYVEWQVLKQLDPCAADRLAERMRAAVTDPEKLLPIRISCYFTGAMMISALIRAGEYSFEPASRPAMMSVLKEVSPFTGALPGMEERLCAVSGVLTVFNADTAELIDRALERNEIALEGPAELVCVNIYDARRLNGFITSTYFLMYKSGDESRVIEGDFVIEMKDERMIERVLRM